MNIQEKIEKYLVKESTNFIYWRININLSTNEENKNKAMKKVKKWLSQAMKAVKPISHRITDNLLDPYWIPNMKLDDKTGKMSRTWDVKLNINATILSKHENKYRNIEDGKAKEGFKKKFYTILKFKSI